MPISRYEIRNEYSLADPDLYRAADKDDPEALLEGVAMAGLVGLLRQLGDLAEFAAEIFHDLHEEVMATAARGHGLMVRVQQLESEVPTIEKAFLLQTDHSSLFYSAAVDWHPNLRMDQNLVTQGDLPRFVMDSYEECRGPPRLFLLDKFDVAGAGACLKRYTDPSFFKIEPPMMTTADVHREKKIRKAKKKGPRWRNGGTPEVIPTSHAKLHQLFLEERVDNGVSKPARRVTLKRRLNGFPFDSRTGKSYMEKLLRSPSPDRKVLHEVTTSSSLAMVPINDHNESEHEVVEFRSSSPERERMGRKRSPPDRDEIMSDPSMHESYDPYRGDKSCEVSDSYPRMVSDEIPYTIDNVNGERDVSVGGDSKMGGSLNGYESDGIVSEVDYVDAPSTIGSEIDTDSEQRVKSDSTSSIFKTQPSFANKDLRTRSSDSQSTGDQTMSDEGNNSSKKESSSFCSSGSLNTSAENVPQDKFLAAGLVSADVPDIDLVDDASSIQKHADENLPQLQHLNPVVTSAHSDSEGSGRKDSTREPELEDKASASDDEAGKINAVLDRTCYRSVSDSSSESEDDHMPSSTGEHVDEEQNTDHEDRNQIGKTELSWNTRNTPSLNAIDTPENIHSGSPEPDKLDEFLELHEECSSDRPDVAENADNILSVAVPDGEKERDESDDEDSIIFTENTENFSCITKSSPGKDFSEASLVNAHNGDVEELNSSYSIENQLSPVNLVLPCSDYSSERPEDITDAHEEDSLENVRTENLDSEAPDSCHVDLPGLQPTDGLSDNHSAAMESSSRSVEILEEPVPQIVNSENQFITSQTIPVLNVEVDGDLASADMTPMSESSCELEQTETADMVSTAPEVSDKTDKNSSSLLADGQEEELTPCATDSDMDELEDDLDSVVISHRHLGLADEAYLEEGTSSDSSSVSYNDIDDGHLNIELSDSVPYPDNASSKNGTNFDDAATLDVQRGLDGEKDILHQNGSMLSVSDSSSSPSNVNAEGSLDSRETGLGLSPVLPVYSHEVPDHDDRKEDNSSGFMFSLVNYSGLPASSELPGVSNRDVTVSELPKDPLGPTFPPSNLPSGTTQVNLDELPPLPPLPPVQWRMGKLFQGLGGERMKHEPFPVAVSPLIASSTASSSLPSEVDQSLCQIAPEIEPEEEKVEHISSSVANSSLVQEMEHSLVQTAPEFVPKEEKVEHGSPSFDATVIHEMIELQPEMENEPLQPTVSTNDVCSSPGSLLEEMDHSRAQAAPEIAPEEEKVEHGSSEATTVMDEMIELRPETQKELLQPTASTNDVCSLPEELNDTLIQSDPEKEPVDQNVELISSSQDACDMSKEIDIRPEIDNLLPQFNVSSQDPCLSLEKMNHSTISISPETVSEQEKDQKSSNSEDNAMTENKTIPRKVENEQLKLLLPFKVREMPIPAEEDGASNEIRPKLPRPRNPLVNDVAALDKSKLRKVTERVRPPIEKVDERDSLLEQIRNKSFNLKPAMASRPSIRGPGTNLKVAAILEKASQIRQAFAGSDDEDDDNWSDS